MTFTAFDFQGGVFAKSRFSLNTRSQFAPRNLGGLPANAFDNKQLEWGKPFITGGIVRRRRTGRLVRRQRDLDRDDCFDRRLLPLQRAHDRPDSVGGDAGVERRRVDLRMSEENLDHSDIGVLLQKVGCKAMPQRMWRHPLGDLGQVCRRMAGAVELASISAATDPGP
jgi:hypothetical protein